MMSSSKGRAVGPLTVSASTDNPTSTSVPINFPSLSTANANTNTNTNANANANANTNTNANHRGFVSSNNNASSAIATTSSTTNTNTTTAPNVSRQESRLHAPDATPPIVEHGMETIINITQRLLGLRGSPPGTMARLSESEIKLLCLRARPIILNQSMLLELEAPIKICGDVHGQYSDLLRLFEYGGFPPVANYLFCGDYVDRGKQSIETISLLLAYKIQYPENFFILRGNHESAGINRIYGFYDECKRRYSIKLWKIFSDVFNCLPVAALVDEKILCMHGGLSPELRDLQQIADLQRPCDVPDVGLLCDLLWSDPSPIQVSDV